MTLLAAQLGVSPATVARAFSRPELLRPETVDRVLGCDDVLATTTHPPLSTIAVDLRAVAEASMTMLLEGPGAQPSGRTLLGARLVPRGTVGPAPG